MYRALLSGKLGRYWLREVPLSHNVNCDHILKSAILRCKYLWIFSFNVIVTLAQNKSDKELSTFLSRGPRYCAMSLN